MLNSYSPKDVSVSFNGIAITGFAEDSMVRIRRNSEILTETVGAQGELSLTKNADKTGEVEVELLQTSESNIALSALLFASEFGGGLIPVGEIIVTDPSGSNLTLAHNAYIKTPPEIELGKDQASRVWVFGCEELVFTSTPSGFSADFSGLTL